MVDYLEEQDYLRLRMQSNQKDKNLKNQLYSAVEDTVDHQIHQVNPHPSTKDIYHFLDFRSDLSQSTNNDCDPETMSDIFMSQKDATSATNP